MLDRDGQPAAGSRVRVIGGDWDEPRALAESDADAEGRFAIASFGGAEDGRTQPAVFGVMTLASDGRLGWIPVRGPLRDGGELAIVLRSIGTARGRLVDHAGAPIAGASVRPRFFGLPRTAGSNATDDILLDTPSAARYRAQTDANGGFTMEQIPQGCRIGVKVQARGLGPVRISWVDGEPPTIPIDTRASTIRGRLDLPADAPKIGDEATISLNSLLKGGDREEVTVVVNRKVPVHADGTVEATSLPPGTYQIMYQYSYDRLLEAERVEGVTVGAGAGVDGVTVPVRRLVEIWDRVVDAGTGAGIAGLAVSANHIDERWFFIDQSDLATTDVDGRYVVQVRPGTVTVETQRPSLRTSRRCGPPAPGWRSGRIGPGLTWNCDVPSPSRFGSSMPGAPRCPTRRSISCGRTRCASRTRISRAAPARTGSSAWCSSTPRTRCRSGHAPARRRPTAPWSSGRARSGGRWN